MRPGPILALTAAIIGSGCPESPRLDAVDVSADSPTPDAGSDGPSVVIADASADLGDAPGASADAGPEVSADAGPEVSADAGPEVSADAGPEVSADAGPEVSADAGPEVSADAGPEVSADAGPEVSADAGPEVSADAGPEVSADAGADAAPQCESACDCPQGAACTEGGCALGPEPAFCCEKAGCPSGSACLQADGEVGLCLSTPSAQAGALVFNEVLIDGQVSGDPNGDGDPGDAVGDEFVEIVNASASPVALDGFTLEETTFVGLPRHTFAAGTTIGPGDAIVVFGGGSAPDDIPGTHFEVANAADVGISFGLALDDSGDTLVLRDATGDLVAAFAWGPAAPLPALSDRSYTRAPEVTGDFVPHDDAQTNVLYSPGTKADGTSF